jgi:hypothetical protein
MRYDRDAVSPWAFFLPIALAVLVGSLVADAIGGMLRDRFDDAPPAVVEQAPAPVDTTPVETAAPVEPAPAAYAPVAQPEPVIEAPNPDAAQLAQPCGQHRVRITRVALLPQGRHVIDVDVQANRHALSSTTVPRGHQRPRRRRPLGQAGAGGR